MEILRYSKVHSVISCWSEMQRRDADVLQINGRSRKEKTSIEYEISTNEDIEELYKLLKSAADLFRIAIQNSTIIITIEIAQNEPERFKNVILEKPVIFQEMPKITRSEKVVEESIFERKVVRKLQPVRKVNETNNERKPIPKTQRRAVIDKRS
jgi:hypothetical protein